MSEKPYHKSKTKLVDTITSDEDDIRFRIWSGEIPLWETQQEIARRSDIRNKEYTKDVLRDYKILHNSDKLTKVSLSNTIDNWIKAYQHQIDINRQLELRSNRRSDNYWNSILELKAYIATLKKEIAMLRQDKVEEMDNVIDLQQRVSEKRKALDNLSRDDKDNWLLPLPEETLFLAKARVIDPRQPLRPILDTYMVVSKLERNVKLLSDLNEPKVFVWVDSDIFCKYYDNAGVLYDPGNQE